MSSFDDFKKKSRSSIDDLTKALEETNGATKSYKDERFWRPELDKASNGFAVIRFLPTPPNEELHSRSFTHMAFRVRVDGSLRTPELLSGKRILFQK